MYGGILSGVYIVRGDFVRGIMPPYRKKHIIQDNINARYWFQVIELESLLFAFIKRLKDADFALFVKRLNDITPWMFTLDHIHYALQQIPLNHPSIFEAFEKGYFIVKSSSQRKFFNIEVNQVHEQNNKLVKIDGGAIEILDNPNMFTELGCYLTSPGRDLQRRC